MTDRVGVTTSEVSALVARVLAALSSRRFHTLRWAAHRAAVPTGTLPRLDRELRRSGRVEVRSNGSLPDETLYRRLDDDD